MERESYIIEALQKQGFLPLFYHADKSTCLEVTKLLYNTGVRAIEFTNRGENAFENFLALVEGKKTSMPDLLLGVGTIRTAEQATRYIEAGADFLVSPVFDSSVADIAYMQKVLWIPGCMTPTEIHVAETAGCKLVKLFPGNVLGPGFVSAIKELFPAMLFMPTGGVEVEEENIRAWFDAGVCAVGLGSKLISKKDLDEKKYEKIGRKTAEAMAIIGKRER
jgi:2-dehydro-3-deoxyphosphogluconate aldolase/(4S)-4-hydroxy-2-oxoglutarate aldolase